MESVFIIVNVDWFFLSHRLPIALAAKKRGYDVTILARDTGRGNEITSNGLKFFSIPLQRSGTNFLQELRTFFAILNLILKYRPDVIHNVGFKPILYGGIASAFLKKSIVINAVSGLGYVFTTSEIKFKQWLFSRALKLGFHKKTKTIFQNLDDLKLFTDLGILNKKNNINIIKGSGVDIIGKYKYMPLENKDYLIVLFPARMLYTKGVKEFCLAAKKVKYQLSNIRFLLIGDNDKENPSSISSSILHAWEKECGVEWLGYKDDMVSQYVRSDIVVLPSYREGLPKSLIEACAIGRPIITTDAPGCRECVIEGENGFLVPVKDVDLLAKRILQIANDLSLRQKMGLLSRKLAEKEFSIISVVDKTLALYNK